MRLKKHKKNRKVVRFYKTCFNFREPFKVLCDGTFINHLLAHKLGDPALVITSLLGGSVKLFVTRCILVELKRLGESLAETLKAARVLMVAKCDHNKVKSGHSCILDVIGDDNSGHFFVASQDADLRNKFRQIRGAPVIFALRNSLLIDQPSSHELEFIKSAEEDRLHMRDSEIDMLKQQKKKRHVTESATDEAEISEEVAEPDTRAVDARRANWNFSTKEKSKFKRKRAKGANPLSCKKKKKKIATT